METLTLDIIVLAMVAMGAAIWFGIWRSWVGKGGSYFEDAALCLPWLALGFVIMRFGAILRSFGIPIPGLFLLAVLIAGLAIGMWARAVQWPDWTLPPWYRELEDDEEEPQW